MNTWNFLDANVWLALLWGRHVHSEKARAWFERSADEQFFFCRFTQITVLRLVTTKEIMGKDAKNRPKPGIFGTKSGLITGLHFFLKQMAWKGGSANIPAFPATLPKSGQMPIFSPSLQSRVQSS